MIKIKLNGERCPKIEDEYGNDLLQKFIDQKIYITELNLHVGYKDSSVTAVLDMHDADIELPEAMMHWKKVEDEK